jgi:TolB-like protein
MIQFRTTPFLAPYIVVLLLLAASFVSGCSRINDTTHSGIFNRETDIIALAYDIADNLVDQSLTFLVPRHPELPVMVSTFVDNNDLSQTSPFGRLLQEHIASRLVQHGFTVREIKLTKTVSIDPKSGETVLSRDLNKINGEIQAQAILAGTLSLSDYNLYVSTRMILPSNGNILASYDRQMSLDDNLLSLFNIRRQDDAGQTIAEPPPPRLNRVLY